MATRITLLPPVPARPDDAHKGTFGTVMVVGGSVTMPGAAALCAKAALRSGAGLAKIASSGAALAVAIAIEPSATGVMLGDRQRDDLEQINAADPRGEAVLAVGPGMGVNDRTSRLVAALVRGQRPVVLDADGLNALAQRGDRRMAGDAPLIMTPHPGEFARLARTANIAEDPTDPDARPDAAVKLAQAHHAIVVLKGRNTIVADRDRVYVNTTGNAALATAGTGDVLTGVIAALIAQKMSPFDAATLGVYLHGLAADLWRDRHGPSGLTARDLANQLPTAFQLHRSRETPR